MDWSGIVIGALAAVAVIAQPISDRFGRRARLRHDVDLLNALPEGSAARTAIQTYVDGSVAAMIANRTVKRRDWTSIMIGATFALLGVWLWARSLGDGSDWWTAPGVLVGFFGLVALGLGREKTERDASGRALSRPKKQRKRQPST